MSNGPISTTGYDTPECVPHNLGLILDLSLQMDAVLEEIDHKFDSFDWNNEVYNEILLGCFRIAFLVDSVIRADP